MAEDLKSMLKKVLTSAGKKKFFFAYGPGKRNDKKGEGELAIRTKKPKKAEIEAELVDPGDIFEGICWSGGGPDNGQTFYFLGKGRKLSTPIVTKMVKTAKFAVGRQYDFQMPSPEEEARVAQFTEGEHEEALANDSPAPPGPAAAPAPPAAAVPAKPPSPPQAGATLIKRLNGMAKEIKAALAGPNKAPVQALFVSVNGLIKKGEIAQAVKALGELESLVKQAPTAAPPQAGEPQPVGSAPAAAGEGTPANDGQADELATELIPQMEARLLAEAQQGFAEYLEMKPAFAAVEVIEAQIEHLRELQSKWRSQVGDRGSKENQEKMKLLSAKLAMEVEAYDMLKAHAAAMDDLMDRIDKAADAEGKAKLVAELQEMMAAFPA